jgi:hypothetical protein
MIDTSLQKRWKITETLLERAERALPAYSHLVVYRKAKVIVKIITVKGL